MQYSAKFILSFLVAGCLCFDLPAVADDVPGTNQTSAPTAPTDPQPVPVGKGSYASFPPNPDKNVQKMLSKPLFIDPSQAGKPIPTNHWWSFLINNPTTKDHGKLWAYPLTLETDAAGATVFYPTTWNSRGNDMEPGSGLSVTGDGFTPQDATALNWGDWSLAIRYPQDDDHRMDVTLGRGMPYAWFEFKGVQPVITMDPKAQPPAVLEDAKGAPLTLPATTNRIVVSQGESFSQSLRPMARPLAATRRV